MFYMIAPPEPTGWHLDHEAFARDLVADWPGLRFQPPSPKSPTRALIWEIPDRDDSRQWLEGSLDRPGEAIYLRGDLYHAARFAMWLRSKVDPAQPLTFIDEAMEHLIELKSSGTSPESIFASFAS